MEKYIFAQEIVRKAGIMIKEALKKDLDIENKSSLSDFVTNIDKGVERFIITEIMNHYPNDGFLTEEKIFDNTIESCLWVLDPIDGTTNLIYQKKDFTISLAYFEEEKGVFGIVYDVMRDRMIVGHRDLGAFENDRKLEMLNQDKELKTSLLYGDVFRPRFFRETPETMKSQFITHRFLGSAALEISNIACGTGQAYVFPKIKLWDVAAALIILKCVGGTWAMDSGIETLHFSEKASYILATSNTNILEGIKTWL